MAGRLAAGVGKAGTRESCGWFTIARLSSLRLFFGRRPFVLEQFDVFVLVTCALVPLG